MGSKAATLAGCLVLLAIICDKTTIADNEFKIVPKLYEEIGCTLKAGGDTPSYECPDYSKRDTNKCYLNGKTYNVNDEVTDDDMPSCRAACRCIQIDKSQPAKIECANVECAELFGRRDPNCINQYTDLKQCCRSGEICGTEKIRALSTCTIDGQEYRMGQRVNPINSCYDCLCTPDFNNELPYAQNTNCKKINCGMELNSDDIRNGCVPIYYKTPNCCSIESKCPSKDDAIETHSDANETLTCKFGELTLKRGDRLKSDDKCKKCECAIPPFITCIQTC